jgi:hypothetical protein
MSEITPEDVARFEKLAGLKPAPDRGRAVADILNAWIPAANELSEKMAASRYRALTPAIRFSDPNESEGLDQ